MKLEVFCKMMRSNIDTFEEDYKRKRKEAVNPNSSYPMETLPQEWFGRMASWFHILEVLGGLNEDYVATPQEDAPPQDDLL